MHATVKAVRLPRMTDNGWIGITVFYALPRIAAVTGCTLYLTLSASSPAISADRTARQVTEMLFQSDPAAPPDLSGLDLQNLDLAGLDFKKASLARSDLFGSDLTRANLSGANLAAARLDRVTLIQSKFDGADLTGASILRPTSFSSLAEPLSEASSFVGAEMAGAKVFGQLNGFNFSGANLKNVSFAPFNETGFIEHIWRTKLESANLTGADLANADLTHVSARYAKFTNANLRNATFKNADLSQADFSGADVSNADFTGADLDQTDFRSAKGLDSVRGLQQTHNRNKALF